MKMKFGLGRGSRKPFGANSAPAFFKTARPDATVRPPMENMPGFSLVSDFSAGHGFAKFGSAPGTYVDDTTTGYRNGRSFKMTTDGTATPTDARKSTTSFDATNKILVIAVKFSDISKITSFDVTVGQATLANRVRFANLQGSQGNKWFRSNEWQLFTIPWQAGAATGTPNRATITDYQVRAISNGGGPVDVWIGAIGWIDKPVAVASMSLDDGYASNYSILYPSLIANNLKATLYVPAESVDGGGRVTLAQIKEMVGSGRVEIGYHGVGNDQRTMTSAAIRALIESDLKYWRQASVPIKTGCYPGGEEDENVSGDKIRDIYAEYFAASRMIFEAQNETIPPPDAHRMRVSPYLSNVDTPASVLTDLNACIASGGWHHQVYHDIVAATADLTTKYLQADFNTNMTNLKNSGIQVKLVSEALGV